MITYICYIDGSYISNIQNKIGHACVIIKNNYIVDVIVDNFVARVKLNSALAELMGLLFSLKHIHHYYVNDSVNIFMDSRYVVDVFNNTKRAHTYLDTWNVIFQYKEKLNVKLDWVKSHSSNIFNNLCDYLSKNACYNDLKINTKYNNFYK